MTKHHVIFYSDKQTLCNTKPSSFSISYSVMTFKLMNIKYYNGTIMYVEFN